MRSAFTIAIALSLAVFLAQPAHADFHGPEDKANARLNKPPGQKLSRRVQQSMDRLRSRGIEDARLCEMLARNSVDKTADGPLIRADRLKDARARIDAYEDVLETKIHPHNLKYRLKVLYSIQRQAIKARISRAEHTDLQLRIASVRRQICEIERNGYSQSRPPEKFTRQVRDAEKCLAQTCKTLKALGKPCSEGSPGTRVVREEPKSRARTPPVISRPPPRPVSKPPSVDPSLGRLRGTEFFYIAGLPKSESAPLRAAPSRVAPVVGTLRPGERIGAPKAPGARDNKRGWTRVCLPSRRCGWVEAYIVTHGTEFESARRAADYYLIGLRSSSVRGMLPLVTGRARTTFESLSKRHPGKKMRDVSTETPERWTARCAACDNGMCQLLYHVKGVAKRRRDGVIFEALKGADGKYRISTTRNYTGADKRWFDGLYPHCWTR